jgi:predicted nucleic acid-binding protein
MRAADAEAAAETGAAVFLDTSVLVPATVEAHPKRRKQIHDCNIVATMITYDVRLLATRNPVDFRRFHPEVSLIAIDG